MLDSESTDKPDSPFIADYYDEVFAMGKACPLCGGPQSWYIGAYSRVSMTGAALRYALFFSVLAGILWLADSIIFDLHLLNWAVIFPVSVLVGGLAGVFYALARIFANNKLIKKAPMNQKPIVEWGDITVEITGVTLPLEDANTAGTSSRVVADFESRDITGLGSWHVCGLKHDNILSVIDIVDLQYGFFNIIEEEFNGTPMINLISRGISERDFHDYVLQLCDALQFLHSQKPGISHNAIRPGNIVVGKGNLLKLTRFENATVGGSPRDDIAMVGEFLRSIKGRYIKRYQEIIESCASKYNSIDELREDFLSVTTTSYTKIIISALAFAVLFLAIIARRLL